MTEDGIDRTTRLVTPQMWHPEKTGKNVEYIRVIVLLFAIKTAALGFALFKGPFFTIEDSKSEHFKLFSVFLDIINIFQFVFIFSVIEKKNLFQFILYIPLFIYSMTLSIILIIGAYQLPSSEKTTNLYLAISALFVYTGVLIFEALIYIFMYIKLRSDFNWTNFKKVGVNPVINEAFKRREEFNAVKRFFIMVFCTQLVNFTINFRNFKYYEYTFTVSTRAIIFFMISMFPNEEYVWQRRILLIFVAICGFGSLGYFIFDIFLYFAKKNIMGALVLESIFYVFNMTILFIGAFRDYQTFGSGLREYYSDDPQTKQRRRLVIVR